MQGTISSLIIIDGKAITEKEASSLAGLAKYTTASTVTTTTVTTTTATTTTATLTTTTGITSTSTTSTTTTVVPCGAGEYLSKSTWNGSSCKPCRYGTFRPDPYPHFIEECAAFARCGETEFELAKGNATHNYVRQTHTECKDGEWESRKPYPGASMRLFFFKKKMAPLHFPLTRHLLLALLFEVAARCSASTHDFFLQCGHAH